MARPLTRGDAGNITVTTIMIAIPLALLIVLALSCGMVFARWSVLSSTLSVARETTMTAGFQMMLKNSADPGRTIAEKLAEELRGAGVNDELTVWFVESEDPALGDTARALAYYAVLKTDYGASTLLGTVEIPCSTSASIVAYSASHAFKPSSSGDVETYRFAPGSTTCTSVEASPAGTCPDALVRALEEAERRAATYEL